VGLDSEVIQEAKSALLDEQSKTNSAVGSTKRMAVLLQVADQARAKVHATSRLADHDHAHIALVQSMSLHTLRRTIQEGQSAGLSDADLEDARRALEVEETKAEVAEAERLADMHEARTSLDALRNAIREGEAAGLEAAVLEDAKQALTLEESKTAAVRSIEAPVDGNTDLVVSAIATATAAREVDDPDESDSLSDAHALAGLLMAAVRDAEVSPDVVGRRLDGSLEHVGRQVSLIVTAAGRLQESLASGNKTGLAEDLLNVVCAARSAGASLGLVDMGS